MLVTQRDREIRRKMWVLDYAARVGSASRACRYFGVGRATFYRWKDVLAKEGDDGLARKKPVAKRHPRQAPPEVVEKVLHLRRTYHMGPVRIMWCLQRYHGVKLCHAGVYRILKRHGLNRLPRTVPLLRSTRRRATFMGYYRRTLDRLWRSGERSSTRSSGRQVADSVGGYAPLLLPTASLGEP